MTHENGPAPRTTGGTGPTSSAAAKTPYLDADHTASQPRRDPANSFDVQLRRRRRRAAVAERAARHADGQVRRSTPTRREVNACAAALWHLQTCGLTGIPREAERQALAQRPDLYADVFPRWAPA